MRPDELNYEGCVNLVGGFWRHVRASLHPDPERDPETAIRRAELAVGRDTTRAWLDDAPRDLHGAPDFAGWCRIGPIDLDPVAWRAMLVSGEPGPLPVAD